MKFDMNVMENNNGNKFITMPGGRVIMSAPLIPFCAYASFVEVFDDEYTIKKEFETTYFIADKLAKGRYIAFTVKNDSMNGGGLYDTPSDSQVLGRQLGKHLWKDGFRSTDYGWIIVCTTGIFHKDISKFDKMTGDIVCSSRNPLPEFPNFELNLNNVHSIYKVIKRSF
ncbi:hypothetical protein [Aquimarina spongiae]|uniref:Uncharacterized protein n=1 Tax=Aquimarina spongiae TaxID=570521 RepID=A0A1M6GJ67_9FLAO|nr:hypothetical protein [Aquimarina spongiae]SHJ09969.1 hypothetical protein SAMN04488508_105308 [Aquimarina spongiae]